MINGIVTKQVGGRFTIRTQNEEIVTYARGKLKVNGVLVGDKVETDGKVITKVLPRINRLIRPTIANVDQIVIVIANKPSTDFVLIDKLIMYADKNNIEVIICVNKIENSKNIFDLVQKQYNQVVKKIIKTSALQKQIEELMPLLKNKTTVFAGQSAVGKSTLLNAIFNKNIAIVGELSKIEKGKNTTRETELYSIDNSSFIADTPGFSCLELINFSPEEVSRGYEEFYEMSKNCKYKQCDHIFVDLCDCEVLSNLKTNNALIERYERYKNLYIETREVWRKRYGK